MEILNNFAPQAHSDQILKDKIHTVSVFYVCLFCFVLYSYELLYPIHFHNISYCRFLTQVLLPIYYDDHWTLVVFSTKYRKIIYCDSVAKIPLYGYMEEDTKLLASYMFPALGSDDWSFEELPKRCRFQKNNADCGFHLLNFMEAAIEDRSVIYDREEFITYKKNKALLLNVASQQSLSSNSTRNLNK